MANEQQIAGSANMVSYIPDRVGLPLQTFKEVGAILTQRYYQNKQAHDSITTSLKNMPTIADEVDKPNLASVSKDVDESFKRIVETDNYHNATSTVMDVSKMLVTDDRIKGLQKNYAALSKWEEDYDKQSKEKGYENWNLYKDRIKSEIKKNYIRQGGSVDLEGKAQGIKLITPTTNLNLEEEVLRIEQIAASVEKTINEQFGGQTSIPQAQLDLIQDPTIKKVMSMMPYSQSKVKTEVRTKQDIRKAVENYLKTDSDYNTKLQEIVQFEHLNRTGRSEVITKDLKDILQSKSSIATIMAISQSPIFQQEKIRIDNKYEESLKSNNINIRNKAISNYNKEISNLYSNTSLLEDGVNNIDKLQNKDISNLYYKTLLGEKHDAVLSSGDRFAVNNVLSRDIHYFDNNFIEVLLKDSEKQSKEFIISKSQDSQVIDIENGILNNASIEGSNFIKVKNAYEAMTNLYNNPETRNQVNIKDYENLQTQYEGLVNKRKAAEDNLRNYYIKLKNEHPEEYNKIENKTNYIVSYHANHYKNILSPSEILLAGKLNQSITSDDLLKLSTKEIMNKYAGKLMNKYSINASKVSANFYNNLNYVVTNSKKDLFKSITDTSKEKGTITVPIDYLSNSGVRSDLELAITKNISEDLSKKKLIDVTTNSLVDIDDETLKTLDFDKASLRIVQGNGAYKDGSVINIRIPVSGKTKDGDPDRKTIVDYKDYTVSYDANKPEMKQLMLEYTNKAIKGLNNPLSSATSFRNAINSLSVIGANTPISLNPNPLQESSSSWDVINMLDNEQGKYSKDFYLHNGNNIKGSTRINIQQDEHGNKVIKFYDPVVTLDANKKEIIRFTKPSNGFNPNGERIVNVKDIVPLLGFTDAIDSGLDSSFIPVFLNAMFPDNKE